MTLELSQVGVICPDCSPTPDGDVPVRPVVVSGEIACWRCHRTNVRVVVAPDPPICEGPTVVDTDAPPHEPVAPGTNRRHSWTQFREAGMLWVINRVLHIFGWAIVVSTDDETGETIGAFPVRTEWRGFDRESEERGYRRVTAWMKAAGGAVAEETEREA